jgi:hypothetical protein
MPTVANVGPYKFMINTLENSYEPPHVHVWIGNEDLCRIELISGSFMEPPPRGERRSIMKAFTEHAGAIREKWNEIHGT